MEIARPTGRAQEKRADCSIGGLPSFPGAAIKLSGETAASRLFQEPLGSDSPELGGSVCEARMVPCWHSPVRSEAVAWT